MLRKIATAVLAASLWALPGHAAEYEIIIVDGAFFPEVSYVQAGDTVVFRNTGQQPRRVFGDQFEFASPMLQNNQAWAMTIAAGTRNSFYAKSFPEGSTEGEVGEGSATAEQSADTSGDGRPMRGVFSFAARPDDE